MGGQDNEVEDIISLIGFGKWQTVQCIWLFLFYLAWSNNILSIVLIGFVPDFTCVKPVNNTPGNWTTDIVFDNQCSLFNSTSNRSETCEQGYVYSIPKSSSIVSEWDLVCGESFLPDTSQSAMSIGLIAGALVFPQLSDRFGRKRIVLYSHAGFAIVVLATAFVPNIWVFIASRVLLGILLFGAAIISWVMTLELFIHKHRIMVALISNIVWAVCTCTLPLIGYLMDGKSWRHLQLAFSVFSLVLIGQMLTLCESIRWLLANGRRKEAYHVIKVATKINNTDPSSVDKLISKYFPDMARDDLPDSNIEPTPSIPEEGDGAVFTVTKQKRPSSSRPDIKYSDEKTASISSSQLFRHPVLRKITLIMFVIWFTNSLTYYGIFLLSSTLPGSTYLNVFLNSVADVPASIIVLPLTLRFGRRTLCVGYHALAGVSLIAAVILEATASGSIANAIQVWVVVLGKFSISSSYMVIYMYTPELYPTNIRSIGFGFADFASRLAGVIAPFTITVARTIPWVPALVFGILCLLVSGLCVFLPETANKELPQTMEDLDLFKTKKKPNRTDEKRN